MTSDNKTQYFVNNWYIFSINVTQNTSIVPEVSYEDTKLWIT